MPWSKSSPSAHRNWRANEFELGAGRSLGKDRARDRDVTLEHPREAVAHLGAGLADRNGAGDVGGAVLVLAAGIDQEQLAGRDGAIGLARDAVMHDRAVGAGAGDGGKGNVLEQAGVAAKAFERRDRIDLGELATRRLAIEPGEEARDRGTVADVRRARAGNLDLVLYRLHQRDRAGRPRDLAAVAGDQAGERIGGGGLIEQHGSLVLAERGQGRHEIGRLAHVGQALRGGRARRSRACDRRHRAKAGPLAG